MLENLVFFLILDVSIFIFSSISVIIPMLSTCPMLLSSDAFQKQGTVLMPVASLIKLLNFRTDIIL
ncbi:hypothetical protein ES708_04995 [subsurface metagenome]